MQRRDELSVLTQGPAAPVQVHEAVFNRVHNFHKELLQLQFLYSFFNAVVLFPTGEEASSLL